MAIRASDKLGDTLGGPGGRRTEQSKPDPEGRARTISLTWGMRGPPCATQDGSRASAQVRGPVLSQPVGVALTQGWQVTLQPDFAKPVKVGRAIFSHCVRACVGISVHLKRVGSTGTFPKNNLGRLQPGRSPGRRSLAGTPFPQLSRRVVAPAQRRVRTAEKVWDKGHLSLGECQPSFWVWCVILPRSANFPSPSGARRRAGPGPGEPLGPCAA